MSAPTRAPAPSGPAVGRLPTVSPVASVQGTLALDLEPRVAPPGGAERGVEADVVPIDVRRRREFEQFCHRVAAAVVEIVGGDRPVSQLLRHTTPEVYADLSRRAQLVARAGGRRPGYERVQSIRPQVRGVHVSFVSDTVAEVSIHVRYGRRSRAVAARFEVRRDRWQVTALEFA